jgi:hypothetical protein
MSNAHFVLICAESYLKRSIIGRRRNAATCNEWGSGTSSERSCSIFRVEGYARACRDRVDPRFYDESCDRFATSVSLSRPMRSLKTGQTFRSTGVCMCESRKSK